MVLPIRAAHMCSALPLWSDSDGIRRYGDEAHHPAGNMVVTVQPLSVGESTRLGGSIVCCSELGCSQLSLVSGQCSVVTGHQPATRSVSDWRLPRPSPTGRRRLMAFLTQRRHFRPRLTMEGPRPPESNVTPLLPGSPSKRSSSTPSLVRRPPPPPPAPGGSVVGSGWLCRRLRPSQGRMLSW